MEPTGWQGGAIVAVILLLALQVLPSVGECQLDDLSDYSEHTEPDYETASKDVYGDGETAQYKCQGGFHPRAPGGPLRTATCRNGRWDKIGQGPLDCMGQPQLPQGCVEPHFPHGRVVGTGRHSVGGVVYHHFGTIAIFDCSDGQRMSARCLQSGNWSSKPPTCTVLKSMSCGNPFPGGVVSNGRPDSLVFNFPSSIKVTCNPGYRLVAHDGSEWGTNILTCQSNGKWNRPAPKCMQVVCPPLRDILKGRVIYSPEGGTLYENATATYQCSGKNYVLRGDAVRRCQNNGTWSGTEPTCEGFDGCVKPEIPNGRVRAQEPKVLGGVSYYPYNTTVIFECDTGYKTSSECKQPGNWNHEPPVCFAVKMSPSSSSTTTTTTTTTRAPATQCSPLSSPASGKLFSVDGFRINASVLFTCDEGYTMRGPSTLVCRPSGAWDPPTTPTCTAPPPWIIILSVCLAALASLVLCCLGFFYFMRRRRRRTPPVHNHRRHIRKPGPYDAISNDEVARLGKPLPTTSL